MVHLVAVLEAAQDADGVLHRRLADEHLLEAALQRGVLFDVLAVLVERGGADQAQLAAGQHRLDHVAGIHRALAGRAGADDGVQLVDERDDLPGRVLDVVEDGLEPFLELAAVLGAGHHRSHIQGDDGLVAQALRDVAVHDALGQALDDRGLADAGLADEHRVVLGATGEHLHDAANLVVPPDDRVELALPGARGQVGGVLLQRLIGGLGVGAGDPGAAAHLDERLPQGLRGGAVSGQQLGDVGVAGGQPDHQVLGGDVFVVHLGGQVLGGGDGGQRFAGQLRLRAGAAGLRQPVQQVLGFGADGGGLDADSLQQRRGDAVVLRQQRQQQVSGPDLGVAGGAGRLQGRCQGRLRLGCRVERVHDTSVRVRGKCLSPCSTPSRLSLFRSTLASFMHGDLHRHLGHARRPEDCPPTWASWLRIAVGPSSCSAPLRWPTRRGHDHVPTWMRSMTPSLPCAAVTERPLALINLKVLFYLRRQPGLAIGTDCAGVGGRRAMRAALLRRCHRVDRSRIPVLAYGVARATALDASAGSTTQDADGEQHNGRLVAGRYWC